MKWTLILCCLLLSNIVITAQNTIKDIQALPIKIKIIGGKMQKAYLMDIDELSVTFFTNKERIKQHLFNECKDCQKSPLDKVEKLILLSNKRHTGKVFGVLIAGMITGYAALNPIGDGVDAKGTAGIYGSSFGGLAFGLGAALDGLNNSKRKHTINRKKTILVKNDAVNYEIFPKLVAYAPLVQFELIQHNQQKDLQVTLLEMKSNPLMHQQRFSFFSKEQPVVSGYLIGNDEQYLFLSDDLFSLVEYRKQLPKVFKKIRLTEILYYQID